MPAAESLKPLNRRAVFLGFARKTNRQTDKKM